MPSAIARALDKAIGDLDNVHENLEILDTMIHELLESTKPKHSLDEDCNCGKDKTARGEKPYS